MPANWKSGIFAAFDTEATGTDPRTARLLALALIEVEQSGEILPEPLSYIIRPTDPTVIIHPAVTDMTGISPAVIEVRGVDLQAVLAELLDRLIEYANAGTPVVCFNTPYHWTLLLEEVNRIDPLAAWDMEAIQSEIMFLDPLVMDRRFVLSAPSRRLGSMAYRYDVSTESTDDLPKWERDALIAARIAREQVLTHLHGATELPRLVTSQRIWHHDQMADFRARFIAASNFSRAVDVRDGWPRENHPEGSNVIG